MLLNTKQTYLSNKSISLRHVSFFKIFTKIFSQRISSIVATWKHQPIQQILNGYYITFLKLSSCSLHPSSSWIHLDIRVAWITLNFINKFNTNKTCHYFAYTCYHSFSFCIAPEKQFCGIFLMVNSSRTSRYKWHVTKRIFKRRIFEY